jgi:hypothetical protein
MSLEQIQSLRQGNGWFIFAGIVLTGTPTPVYDPANVTQLCSPTQYTNWTSGGFSNKRPYRMVVIIPAGQAVTFTDEFGSSFTISNPAGQPTMSYPIAVLNPQQTFVKLSGSGTIAVVVLTD